MRQFYQHYFTATAKLCWLRWLSVHTINHA